MPEFKWDPEQLEDYWNIGPIEENQLAVDGKVVPVQLEQKAFLGKLDVTSVLRKTSMSDEQIFHTFGDAHMQINLRVLSPEEIERLNNLGLLQDLWPKWSVRETARWQLKLKPGRETLVQHSYQPFSGMVWRLVQPQDLVAVDPLIPSSDDDVCVNEGAHAALMARMRSLFQQGAKSLSLSMNDIEYIPNKTGIGVVPDFRLDIMKESPEQIVSLCFPGKGRRLNDKTIEFRQPHFTLPERVRVNFYTVTLVE
jgi:hypothetical protein